MPGQFQVRRTYRATASYAYTTTTGKSGLLKLVTPARTFKC